MENTVPHNQKPTPLATQWDKEVEISSNKFVKAASRELDPVSIVLRLHLLAEFFLDQIIIAKLSRGDLLVDHFTFIQKLRIVDSFSVLEHKEVDSLRNLNTVRNRCSHDLDYQLTESDIDRIGRPFGKQYADIKTENHENIKNLLINTLQVVIIDINLAAFQVRGIRKTTEDAQPVQ